ncbi:MULTISPECIES: 2'-5' RNA ligase family protein [Rhizobium]|uniref:2'-5' RNA ligase n=1 Tax=Rhizobium paranaense TaxID=1650438 RepID=A0A7W9D2H8_9HYPH|nr:MULTISPECIES: 2'-5' RNA ligase family protein [Rhizobium]MBB5575298.1 2'-5' RNA ligase [Rhizobium paranaense]PST64299.1 2'-5' RNA ligase [Rhizobium sp. SEMIA4064]
MKNNGQLSLNLGGGSRVRKSEADPMHSDALYFAILPDREVASSSAELAGHLRRQYGFSTKPRRSDLFHITLYPLGSYNGRPEPPHEVAFAAMQAASTVSKTSFQVVFDRAVSFGNGDNRPLVLWRKEGNAELKALYRELDDAMRHIGFASDGREKFEPHMTLLYRGHLIPEVILDEPVTWTVRDFVLVHSLQGEGEHKHLCYWPLN